MQIQKDEIRNRILIVASSEFMKNGVKHTSIKTIADKAGVAVGNVYNYYKSKDDLLKAVLAPLQGFQGLSQQNWRRRIYNARHISP